MTRMECVDQRLSSCVLCWRFSVVPAASRRRPLTLLSKGGNIELDGRGNDSSKKKLKHGLDGRDRDPKSKKYGKDWKESNQGTKA